MIGDFTRGTGYAFSGIKLVVTTPKIWPLVLVPFLLTLLALIGVVWLALSLRESWLGWLPDWGWLQTIASIATWILLPIIAYFLFLPLASIIAAPFNELIAEHVEERMTGKPSPPFSVGRLLAELGLAVVHGLRKLLRWALLALVVLILSLIPVVGVILSLLGGAYLAARFAAWDALDATWSRWGWSYAQKNNFLRMKRSLCLGLGAVTAAMLVVPILNAVAMPMASAGGAMLAVDASRNRV